MLHDGIGGCYIQITWLHDVVHDGTDMRVHMGSTNISIYIYMYTLFSEAPMSLRKVNPETIGGVNAP